MIRGNIQRQRCRSSYATRGRSLAEIGFAVLAVGVIFAFTWFWAQGAYNGVRINTTTQQMSALVPAIREAYAGKKIAPTDDLSKLPLQLPPELVKIQDDKKKAAQRGLFNAWEGKVWGLPGNGIFWGIGDFDKEFTIVMEGIPSSACPKLVMEIVNQTVRMPGLISVFIAPGIGSGDAYCVSTDTYCKSAIRVTEDVVHDSCHSSGHVLISFSYSMQ